MGRRDHTCTRAAWAHARCRPRRAQPWPRRVATRQVQRRAADDGPATADELRLERQQQRRHATLRAQRQGKTRARQQRLLRSRGAEVEVEKLSAGIAGGGDEDLGRLERWVLRVWVGGRALAAAPYMSLALAPIEGYESLLPPNWASLSLSICAFAAYSLTISALSYKTRLLSHSSVLFCPCTLLSRFMLMISLSRSLSVVSRLSPSAEYCSKYSSSPLCTRCTLQMLGGAIHDNPADRCRP